MLSLLTRARTDLPGSQQRLEYVDGLRGLAMLVVLIFHTWTFSGMWHLRVPGVGFDLARLLHFGYTGVHLFLVLSGFCLYWPLARNPGRKLDLREFARRRCRRILPPYYVSVALFGGWTLALALLGRSPFSPGYVVKWSGSHLLMLHNLFPAYIMTIDPPLWSLALEFQLYILFPLFVWLFVRTSPLAGALIVLFACFGFRAYASTLGPAEHLTLFQSVLSRCCEFVMGMLAAKIVADWHRGASARQGWLQYGALFGVVACCIVVDHFLRAYDLTSDIKFSIVYMGLVLAASRSRSLPHRLLSMRGIVTCGVVSYSVYLVHEPFVTVLGKAARSWGMHGSAIVAFDLALVVPLMLAVGYLFHLLFEKPFMTPARPRSTRPAGATDRPTGARWPRTGSPPLPDGRPDGVVMAGKHSA